MPQHFMKSSRNRTLSLDLKSGAQYLERCVTPETLSADARDVTICGDVLKACAKLAPQSVDLVVADPPYNLHKQFHGGAFPKQSREDYAAYTRQWLSAVHPLVKPTGSLYICCDWQSSRIIADVLEEFYILQNRITWQREKGRGAKRNWKNAMEDIWFATRSNVYTFNLDAVKIRRPVMAPYRKKGAPKDWTPAAQGAYRDTCPSNLWDDITIPFWSMPENTAHPTQKPEKLVAKLILASSSPGDVVLDPFLGSGTTSVVAKKLGRHYIGIEHTPLYCIWAEKRLEDAASQRRIQGYEDGIFFSRNMRTATRRL